MASRGLVDRDWGLRMTSVMEVRDGMEDYEWRCEQLGQVAYVCGTWETETGGWKLWESLV